MRKFLASCFLLMTISCVFGAERRVIMQNPYINNPYYRHVDYYQSEVLPRDLSALEKYAMNRTYFRENPIKRLERLEDLAFGSIQNGDIESRYKNVEAAILARPKYNTRRTPLGTLTNFFNGQPTGITPSVYDSFGSNFMPAYDRFMHGMPSNDYGNMRINQYSNGIFGNGYNVYRSNTGNGSSIRILD